MADKNDLTLGEYADLWFNAKADLRDAVEKEIKTREALVRRLADEGEYECLQLNQRALHKLVRPKQ